MAGDGLVNTEITWPMVAMAFVLAMPGMITGIIAAWRAEIAARRAESANTAAVAANVAAVEANKAAVVTAVIATESRKEQAIASEQIHQSVNGGLAAQKQEIASLKVQLAAAKIAPAETENT